MAEKKKSTSGQNPNSRANLAKGKATQFKNGEQAAAAGKKGGRASQAAQHSRKTTAQLISLALSSSVNSTNKKTVQSLMPDVEESDINVKALMIAGQAKAAAGGDARAFNAIMDIERETEEKERARLEALKNRTYHIDLDDIPDNFHPLIRDIRRSGHLEYTLKGGRGSTKSTFVSMVIPELIHNNPDIHALVCRKVANTIKNSVYSKIKWAIEKQGDADNWKFTSAPMEMTYLPTGQKIYFRGADDKDKIKSISPEFGYIGVLWFEELDAFSGPEEIRSIEQSAIRGGEKAWIFESFNPPRTANNWANIYSNEPKENRVVHHSTYKDVPREWLGTPFIDEAEHLKEINPAAYEHEYEGVANGTGGAVFEQLGIREITDDEIKEMDRIYQGVDWGWFPDHYAFIRCHYDAARETIYLIDEHYVNKQSNEETAAWIKEKGYNDFRITCDSAEPKSVADYKGAGLAAYACMKGPGSVEYSMKWLQRRKIVIDPKRTPSAYKEFTEYEYERDKDGNIISGYPDANNHAIDALRYALNPLWRKRGAMA